MGKLPYFILAAILPTLFIFFSAEAASTFKCTERDGSITYTYKPCKNSKMELLHKDTKGEVQQKKYRRDVITINSLVSSERLDEAYEHAKANNMADDYDAAIKTRQDSLERQAKIQEENNRRIAEYNELARKLRIKNLIMRQRRQIARQQQQITQQDPFIGGQGQSTLSSHPQYVPSVGKWCQQTGGSMNCW